MTLNECHLLEFESDLVLLIEVWKELKAGGRKYGMLEKT